MKENFKNGFGFAVGFMVGTACVRVVAEHISKKLDEVIANLEEKKENN